MGSKKIIQVVGARPNFMKVAPIHREIIKYKSLQSVIVHTGQHFDTNMSEVFIQQLELPTPDYFLGVGSGSHTQLTAKIMLEFEKIIAIENPDMVIVVGDVTSTFACALTAVRMQIPVAHVEAGLRSFDNSMPEEINRRLTDQISDVLYVTEESALHNLKNENIDSKKIQFVGNCMIDSLVHYLPKLDPAGVLNKYGISNKPYALMTMHRPSNVDNYNGLQNMLALIKELCAEIHIIFPLHPRTFDKLKSYDLTGNIQSINNLHIAEPLAYKEFVSLMQHAKFIITDSGGIQEESTFLKVPCLTLRKTTERPVTIDLGSNILIEDLSIKSTMEHVRPILLGQQKPSSIPPLWDGLAANRIVKHLIELL